MTHIFRHPKYYKEMRKARKLTSSQASGSQAPTPGPRVQAKCPSAQAPVSRIQGTSAQAHEQGNRQRG